jgi:pimeloyl-ACP methyl ester carboxylesterase
VSLESIRANGLTFSYLAEGSGPLVLLLHGFPDTAHTWDRSITELARAGFRAVAPFMRGYAPTEIPADGDYRVETLAADAAALIEALGETSAIVVGHDWGASAAFALASFHPERVRMLVTLAIPHPKSLKPSPMMAWKIRHFVTLRRKNGGAKLRRDNFAYVDELWKRWSPAWKNIAPSETAPVKASLAQPGSAEAAAAYYAQLSFRTPYRQVKMPAVAFAGEHDMIAPRAYEKARHCYDASYEVVNVPGGHFMHREHPDVFVPELVRVIQDHEPRLRR